VPTKSEGCPTPPAPIYRTKTPLHAAKTPNSRPSFREIRVPRKRGPAPTARFTRLPRLGSRHNVPPPPPTPPSTKPLCGPVWDSPALRRRTLYTYGKCVDRREPRPAKPLNDFKSSPRLFLAFMVPEAGVNKRAEGWPVPNTAGSRGPTGQPNQGTGRRARRPRPRPAPPARQRP